jgi:hypothetical protein
VEYNALQEFPEVFLRMPTIEKLFLGHNQIKSIPRLIVDLPQLKFLRLTGNPISIEQIEKIKQILPDCNIETNN